MSSPPRDDQFASATGKMPTAQDALELAKELGWPDDTRERLAEYAHAAWSGWLSYMFSKGEKNADGSLTIPPWAVERWERQSTTGYADLPEQEKASDRDEADRILAIVRPA